MALNYCKILMFFIYILHSYAYMYNLRYMHGISEIISMIPVSNITILPKFLFYSIEQITKTTTLQSSMIIEYTKLTSTFKYLYGDRII